jgi:hypothetical protein
MWRIYEQQKADLSHTCWSKTDWLSFVMNHSLTSGALHLVCKDNYGYISVHWLPIQRINLIQIAIYDLHGKLSAFNKTIFLLICN